jgi:hypothetical protein
MGLLLPNGEEPSSIKAGGVPIRRVYRGSQSLWSDWNPKMSDNLLFWLDFSAPSTFTTTPGNASEVTDVADKSDNGLSAIDSPLSPNTGTTTLNSLNVLGTSTTEGLCSSSNDALNMQDVYVVGKWTGGSTFNTYNGLFQGKNGAGTAFGDGIRGMSGTNRLKGNAQFFDNLYLNGVSRSVGASGHYEDLLSTMSSDFIISVSADSSIGVNGYRISGQNQSNDRGWSGNVAEVVAFSTKLSDDERKIVEGYLANKWGIQSVLPSGHPYKTTRPQTFTPADITTSLWLDAQDSSTITHSSNAVSQWDDKSGNGNHATQSTASSQPTYSSTVMAGGKPGLDFNVDYMSFPEIDGTDKTLFFVFEPDAAVQNYLLGHSTNNIQTKINTSNKVEYANNPQWYPNGFQSSTAISLASISIVGFVLDSTLTYSVNGTAQNDPTKTRNTSIENTKFDQIGKQRSFDPTLNGKIGEIVVMDSVSSTDREKMEGYLAHKWGLTSNLPSDHPYKTLWPTT